MSEIIQNNIEGKENSFIYFLHEEGVFDEKLFHVYFENVNLLDIEKDSREVIKKVIEVNEYIYRNIIYHFDIKDSHVLKNLPQNLNEYIEIIDFANRRLIHAL